MVNWPEHLVREIADRRAIIFIGSGISKTAYTRLPTWPELLTELSNGLYKVSDRKLVKSLIKTNQLLEAAQILTDGIDRPTLNGRLTTIFQIQPMPTHEIYDELLQFDLKIIITTNYDEILERNFYRASGGYTAYNVFKYTSRNILEKIRSPQRVIAKIHGCITDPDDLVLDRVSYFNAKQSFHGFFNVINSLFTVNTILFLGYSLSDPDLQIMLENIHANAASSHGHYALISKLEHKSISSSIKKHITSTVLNTQKGSMNMCCKA